MKKSSWQIEKIIEPLKRAEAGWAVQKLCRELGTSAATFYKWRATFGGMDASVMDQKRSNLPQF